MYLEKNSGLGNPSVPIFKVSPDLTLPTGQYGDRQALVVCKLTVYATIVNQLYITTQQLLPNTDAPHHEF